MGFKSSIDSLKNELETNLPALISTAGLPAFDEFVYYSPSNTEIFSVGVYSANNEDTKDNWFFRPLVRVQLPGILDERVNSYEEIVFDFLKSIDPHVLNMSSWTRLRSEVYPIDETNSADILFFPEWKYETDDCDDIGG